MNLWRTPADSIFAKLDSSFGDSVFPRYKAVSGEMILAAVGVVRRWTPEGVQRPAPSEWEFVPRPEQVEGHRQVYCEVRRCVATLGGVRGVPHLNSFPQAAHRGDRTMR